MRKKILARAASLLLVAAVLISTLALPAYATIDDERQDLNKLEDQKSDVQGIIAGLEQDKKKIEDNIVTLDAELSTISEELYETEKELASVEKKITKNEKKLDEAQKSITEQYGSMKLRIQFMYENGNQEMISLILSSENIGDFLNKAEYISELSTYDRKMLDKMVETKNTIEKTQKTLVEQKNTLTVLKQDQEKQKSDIETLVAAKQKEIQAYDSKIAANEAALDELDTAIGNQQEVIAEMERIEEERRIEAQKKAAEAQKKAAANGGSGNSNSSANTNVPSEGVAVGSANSGGYVWPLPGYTAISSGFGYRSDPFTGKQTYHSGIDLPAPSGTPIVAAAAGEVAWANYSSTAGNWVGIDHGNGVYTVYMHMSALLTSTGQSVSAGQTIGLVGTTGSSTGNHLHFSVRLNGAYTNPLNYVGP